mmetsp:Transcript_11363/g.25651  ORF Transcript_11363/g.25651 Transcript_11363/m.25651 type:complete len:242 (+) Transcript_11363:354-1079(+)
MPTSAAAKAGASLMPSPTIATTQPSRCCSLPIRIAFSSGSNGAWTSEIPADAATALAVASLSPLSMLHEIPDASRCDTTSTASGRSGSATANAASVSPSRIKMATLLALFSCAANQRLMPSPRAARPPRASEVASATLPHTTREPSRGAPWPIACLHALRPTLTPEVGGGVMDTCTPLATTPNPGRTSSAAARGIQSQLRASSSKLFVAPSSGNVSDAAIGAGAGATSKRGASSDTTSTSK